jgi:hypothetical protein
MSLLAKFEFEFEFESNQVRIVTINGEPWFVAKDILQAIGSSTTVTAVEAMIREDLGDDFFTNKLISDTIERDQNMLILSEPALTMFVSRSRTELGKALNRWIHAEVIPSIRKTGKYEVEQPIAPPEPKPLQLPPADIRLVELFKILDRLEIDINNPRFKQHLQDFSMDMLGVGQPALKAEDSEVWCGVAERAEQLGYPISMVTEYRPELGKAVSMAIPISRTDARKNESRLCNGTQRLIGVYRVTEELDTAICNYFDNR